MTEPTLYSVKLPQEPRSASLARHFVREVLRETGHERWSETAELAVSELITNAVLHARTEMELLIESSETEIVVKVRDGNPALPESRGWGETATTGRGLKLIASATAEHGVTPLPPPDGKEVWFRIDDTVQQSAAEENMEEWDLDEFLTIEPENKSQTCATLKNVPVLLWLAGQQQHEALLREMYLHQEGRDTTEDDLPLDEANAALSALTKAIGQAIGKSVVDQINNNDENSTPPTTVDAYVYTTDCDPQNFTALQDVLDESCRLAWEGQFLIRPPLPEIVALRDWACEQIQAQKYGVSPVPWTGTVNIRTVIPAAPEWNGKDNIDHSPLNKIAIDDHNRIIAISRPACELLGWKRDDLLGQRVVQIIPPRYRDAHVAGFTRHLTTGTSKILARPIDLPALHLDGHEIFCRFLITSIPTSHGQAVYVAEITEL